MSIQIDGINMRLTISLLLALFSLQNLAAQEALDDARKRVATVKRKHENAQSKLDRYNELTDWINVYQPTFDKYRSEEQKLDADIQKKRDVFTSWDKRQGFVGDSTLEKLKNLGDYAFRKFNDLISDKANFDAYTRSKREYNTAKETKQVWLTKIDDRVKDQQIKFKDPSDPRKGDGSGGFVYVRSYDKLKMTLDHFKTLRDALGDKDLLAANVKYYRFELDNAEQKLTTLLSSNDRTIPIPTNPARQPQQPMTGAGSVDQALPNLSQPVNPNPPAPTPSSKGKADASIRIVEPVHVDTGSGQGLHRIHRFFIELKSNSQSDVSVKLVDVKLPGGQVTDRFKLRELSFPKSKYDRRSMFQGERIIIPAPRPLHHNESSTQTVGPFYLTTWTNAGHKGTWAGTFEIARKKEGPGYALETNRKTVKFSPKAPKGKLLVEAPAPEKLKSIDSTGRTVYARVLVPGLAPGPHKMLVRVNNITWHIWAQTPEDAGLTEFKGRIPYPVGPFTMTLSVPDAPELGSQSMRGSGKPPSESIAKAIERARERVKKYQARDQSKLIAQWYLGDAWLGLANEYSRARDHARALECARRAEALLPTPETKGSRNYSGKMRWSAWEAQLRHAFRLGDANTYRQVLQKQEARHQAKFNSLSGNNLKTFIGARGWGLQHDAHQLLMMGVSPDELIPMVEQARKYVKQTSGRELDTSWFPR